jgi:hypothetical protein
MATAEGRAVAPQYWAGLVLIGNTAPIGLNTRIVWWWYVLGGIVGFLLLALIIKRNSSK